MLINDFYANREVFITGATGFLGKGLIEKLLRDCPRVKAIYILLRAKRAVSPEERLEQFKKDKVFERLHQQQPDVLNKLCAIQGDCGELGLGISPADLNLLQNVSIVFHMAANVKFDEPFRSSILLNTRGTYELLKIAENLKNLVVFLYCSTAYCNALEDTIEERVYDMPAEWRKVIQIAETYDEETLNILFLKFTHNYPNTYTFTKNLSEQMVKEYSDRMPMSIFRPSVVVSAYREPLPGWNDNLNGPMGLMTGLAMGLLPIGHVRYHCILDILPVDVVTKLTIVAAYKRGMQHIRKETIPNGLEVVNCTSADTFKVSFEAGSQVYIESVRKNPIENAIWYYGNPIVTEWYYNFLFQILIMSVPMSLVLDGLSLLTGRKMIMMKMSRRIVYTTKALIHFISKDYKFKYDNMLALEDHIPQSELGIYSSKDCYTIDYNSYSDSVLSGIKYFIFNQPRQATPAARKRAKVLYVASTSIKMLIISLIVLYLKSILLKF